MPRNMKYFKSFFKHTWHPQQMVVVPSPGSIWDYPHLDQLACVVGSIFEAGTKNSELDFLPSKSRIPEIHMESSSRFELTKPGNGAGETELGEVTSVVATTSVPTSTPVPTGTVPCQNGGCKSWVTRGDFRPESPWHLLKTIFLITVIGALIVWVIVYTLLAKYNVL